jgi:endoglucanase
MKLIIKSFYSSWSGYGDELGWSAMWLYKATGEAKYLSDFEAHWNEFELSKQPLQFSWDDKTAGLQVNIRFLWKIGKPTN